MTNPVHAYMLPVAVVLVVFSAVFAVRLARAWQALNDRLDRAAAGVRRIWRGGSEDVAFVRLERSTPGTRLVAIWLPLAQPQIALYLLQENVEAVASSQPTPGFGAITGIHWAAPLVHLYVSLLLACIVRICQIVSAAARSPSSTQRHSCTPSSGAAGPLLRSSSGQQHMSYRRSNALAGASGEGRLRSSSTSDRRP